MRNDSKHGIANLGPSSASPIPPADAFNRAEAWLGARVSEAANTRQRKSRLKIQAIFLLMRHAAMHLCEIASLKAADFDPERGILRIADRDLALPQDVNHKLGKIFPELACHAENFLDCEPSQVRRSFARCASALGLPLGMLSGRVLRRERARELEGLGLHPALVDSFLGRAQSRRAGHAQFSQEAAQRLLRARIQRHDVLRSSARNVFRGVISKVQHRGILADIFLDCGGGCMIEVSLTQDSVQRLGLAKGVNASALVKAPFIHVSPLDVREKAINSLEARLDEIRSDDEASELLLRLPGGQRLCALCAPGCPMPRPALGLAVGDRVLAHFSPFAAILSVP